MAALCYCSFFLSMLCVQMLSIFPSQLISGLFVRLCMQGLNLERHGDDKKERNGWGQGEKERDKLISDLKWQFVVTFCPRNATLMKKCINKGCREDIRLLQVNGRDRGRGRDVGGVEKWRERVNRLNIFGYLPLVITDSGSDFTYHQKLCKSTIRCTNEGMSAITWSTTGHRALQQSQHP